MPRILSHAQAVAEKKRRQKRYAVLANAGANLYRSCSLGSSEKSQQRNYIPAPF